MAIETIYPEHDTSMKATLEELFFICCRNIAVLRSFLTTNKPGAYLPVFREFKENFDLFYTASSIRRELNPETIKKVRSWLNRARGVPSEVREGIALFEEYKTELSKNNILKLG